MKTKYKIGTYLRIRPGSYDLINLKTRSKYPEKAYKVVNTEIVMGQRVYIVESLANRSNRYAIEEKNVYRPRSKYILYKNKEELLKEMELGE